MAVLLLHKTWMQAGRVMGAHPQLDVPQALDGLEARLHQRRPLGVEPELVNKCLHVLLLRIQRLGLLC